METNHSSSCRKGVVSVVGTGPGSLDYLTPAARSTLEEAEVIVGYTTYLTLLGDIIKDKRIISSAMMQEVERVKHALSLAEQGARVALVSGGDPGIYAMAGLVFEVARASSSPVEIRVVAGVAALNSCAERLGAPLMHDFAAISLSDLLTPWPRIEQRIEAAAAADFVIVLYNPRSKKRIRQLPRAFEIIGKTRPQTTPVGIVKGATRENEEVIITTLATFDPEIVDMQTTIIVGNSVTFIWQNKMITPRGYNDKYQLD